MVDLILLAAIVTAFAGGFWCGHRFASYKDMWQAAKDKLP
jgi:hypothetical protein